MVFLQLKVSRLFYQPYGYRYSDDFSRLMMTNVVAAIYLPFSKLRVLDARLKFLQAAAVTGPKVSG